MKITSSKFGLNYHVLKDIRTTFNFVFYLLSYTCSFTRFLLIWKRWSKFLKREREREKNELYHSIYSELIPFERTVVWNSIRHTRNRRIPSKFKSRGENYVFNTMRRELKIGVFNVVEHAPRQVQENVQTLQSAGKYYPMYHVTTIRFFIGWFT